MPQTDTSPNTDSAPSLRVVIAAGLAAFCAYFAMYAFRRPFTAATFESVPEWGFLLDYKSALIISQVLGYALSKLIGIKVISELESSRRAVLIVGLVIASWLALVAFALVPAPWNVAALFLNGLPLGMIWGLVFSYLEGRRTTEILGAILASSFIVSSGVVKSVGVWLMNSFPVSEFWMPAVTGLLFFPPLLVSVFVLTNTPPPSADDIDQRVARVPMDKQTRRAYYRQHAFGLTLLVITYVLLTTLRDFRDNFAVEIWASLGFEGVAAVFTQSETVIAFIALLVLGLVFWVKDNLNAVLAIHGLVIVGLCITGVSTLLLQFGAIEPMTWMIASGAGMYIGYVPFNAILFDRLVAATGQLANAGFLIYVADSSGYVGSASLLLMKHFVAPQLEWLSFYTNLAYTVTVLGIVLVTTAMLWFRQVVPRQQSEKRVANADKAHLNDEIIESTKEEAKEMTGEEEEKVPAASGVVA